MNIINTDFKDLFILETSIHNDFRGYFKETYKNDFFNNNFPEINFIQENESKSKFGVLRGLHFQTSPMEQTKLVRVVKGKVQDVVVDLRKGSKTFGKHFSIILSEKNKKQLLIPKGFAHGFLTLSKYSIFNYKVDNPYSTENESGIKHNDEDLAISWKLENSKIKLSEKDKSLNKFKDLFTDKDYD